MGDFTLRQLEYFVAVVEAESVTAAAQRLHVSPGGVSLALKELETSLKVQLTLRRRGKGVAVTPAGRWVYEHAQALLARSADISAAARIVRGELTGPLRIGCFSTLSPWLFPRIAAHFAESHPGVDVQLVEDASAVLHDRMLRGELDVVLNYSNHLGPGIASAEIAPVRLVLAVAPSHRLAEFDEVPLRELKDETAILVALQPATSHVEDILRSAGFEPRVRWRSANVETIRSMVARGLGYTIIMGRPQGDRTYDGLPLAYRRIADDVPPNSVVVAYPEGTIPTAKVSTLIAFCRHEFGKEGRQLL
ncbi:LysR family transcriptional regulator [Streptomyces tuirus]|uniref:LysR family transcriptional regulator n=1 Tax=Streptomyces tuirus TaxID=68278 RepID=A0A941FKN2_9ACTN|nr:LysR family transcriptional regulator [Streptomyces tuirus]